MIRHTVSGHFRLLRDFHIASLDIKGKHSISWFRPMVEKKIIAIKTILRPASQCHVTNLPLDGRRHATDVVMATDVVTATDVII